MRRSKRDSWRPTEAELRKMADQFFVNWAHLADIAENLRRIAVALESLTEDALAAEK